MTEANDRLRRQLDDLLGQYDTMRRSMTAVHERMREISGSAESPDRMVKVTVCPRGTLTDLSIDPKAYRKLSPSQLAETILATARKATQDANGQQEELLRPLLPPGMPVSKLVAGEADPQTWDATEKLTGASLEEWWSGLAGDASGTKR